jgi:D-serine deaminase-like pyridoxal phosphate-dependent protein
VRVSIDSLTAAEALASAARAAASTIGILVDIDVGFHRTGLQSAADALKLAQFVDREAGLRLDGIMFFPGHIIGSAEQQAEPLAKVSDILNEVISVWDEHGLEAGIVSGGSTPAAYYSHLIPEMTEIRPGTYVYNDMNTVRGGYCRLEDCAARFICTVVSDAVPGQIVIDAGSKTLTSDRCNPALDSGHGYIVEYPEAKIGKLSEEHGMVDIRACKGKPKVGDQVTVIPNHICPCVNLQDRYWWIEPGSQAEANPVDARGMLS